MNFEMVGRIYTCSSSGTIVLHEVADAETAEFAANLALLGKSVAEIEAGDHFEPILSCFRRIRFVLASTPIPPLHETVRLDLVLERLRQMMSPMKPAFPELVSKAVSLAGIAEAVFRRSPNGLEGKLLQLVAGLTSETRVSVVVKDSNLAEATAIYFSEKEQYSQLRVVSPFELRDAQAVGRIFVLGSPRWLIDDGFAFLFHAPRTQRTDVISYDWLRNEWKIEPVFPRGATAKLPSGIRILRDAPRRVDFVEAIEPHEILPVFNVEAFKQQLPDHNGSTEEDSEDLVEARVALLAGSKAVFLDNSDGAGSYTIDLRDSPDEQEEEAFLVREPNTDIEEGKFLLLRTQGGGDLIPIIAQKILGMKAAKCDAMQQKWKDLLKWYVERQGGREQTAKKLAALGATAARPVNIGNWVCTRNIRPGADGDFIAVLKLVGLEPETALFFENARLILNSRRRAGATIRKLLLAEVMKSNLAELRQKGVMTFQLTELGAGGSMTALRIEKILPDVHRIPYAKVLQPFPVSEDLWL